MQKAVIDEVFGLLLKEKIINLPQMRYLTDDNGVTAAYLDLLHRSVKKQDGMTSEEYGYILCYMAFSGGVYISSRQWVLGKGVGSFSKSELDGIFYTLSKEDAVSLSFDALRILEGSYRYKAIEQGIKDAYLAAVKSTGFSEGGGFESLPELFFNVGVTLTYERFS